jgi:hypothetical protein
VHSGDIPSASCSDVMDYTAGLVACHGSTYSGSGTSTGRHNRETGNTAHHKKKVDKRQRHNGPCFSNKRHAAGYIPRADREPALQDTLICPQRRCTPVTHAHASRRVIADGIHHGRKKNKEKKKKTPTSKLKAPVLIKLPRPFLLPCRPDKNMVS